MVDPSSEEEEWEEEEESGEEGEEEMESSEEEVAVLCPVCGSTSVRLIEIRDHGGFYECEGCGATFEEGS